ncbi:MAG: DMT family transporter [Eubacterium pyruvativorans]|uniref:DMT family transporter n=1 Tax=Eubacterium pyruvativorans TaxID=155865 RepID=UPI002A82A4FD|nr:DMT family transporter [Eubacterium pyruvativorans]MDY4049675.1 DMT family transporter [Eubacterium pyruvativorans]
MSTKTKSNLVLLLTTLIWGTAFIAQKNGGSIGAFTFNGIRTVIGGLSILPVIWWMNRHPDPEQSKKYRKHGRWSERKTLVIGGCLCGTALFLGANLQQMGINYTTVSKAGFITSLYSILVPVLALFIGKKVRPVIWLCMAVSAVGLYLLCMRQEAFRLQLGDALILVCAVFFAVQILLVDYFIQFVNPVKLSFAQTMFSGIVSIICMFLFEHPVWSQILGQALPILYAGVMSSGVAYTLQMVGQKGADPTQAALILCLESVFSALSGALLLREAMSLRQYLGCGLIFGAVVVSQLPGRGTEPAPAADRQETTLPEVPEEKEE